MLWELSKGFRWLVVISMAATVGAVFMNFLTPQVFRFTVDSVLGEQPYSLPGPLQNFLDQNGGRDFLRNNLILCAGASMACSVVSGIFNLCRITMAKASEGMINVLRNRLYAHIQRLPYHWHIRHQTGDIIQRCTSDVEVVRSFLSDQLLEMFRTVFLIVVALVLMFSMNLKLSLIAAAFIPVMLFYSGFFFSKIARNFQKADEAEGALSAAAQENFTGVRVVRAFGRQAYEIDRFRKKNEFFSSLWIKLNYFLAYYWGVGDFVSNLQVLAIIVFGCVEAVNGSITLGEFLVFVSYNSMLVWPVRSLGRILSEMSKTGVSMTRIGEILSAEEETDPDTALTPAMNGDIVFSHVQFDYRGVNGEAAPSEAVPAEAAPGQTVPGEAVLRDVSFTIKAGSTVGILGGTGSGKSTLMYLLDRLYDLPEGSGSITIGGVDIRSIRRDWLRKNVGFVLQEPFLFSKTIKENIGISAGGGDMAAIRRSAAVACVDEAITEFSQGYDTVVGERGVTLSGGQKQRVAIARMLMQQSPIMIFDDSLSAVDSETDAKIRAALKANTGESTVILISHRITTLMHADQIIVLDKGAVSQIGTHEELAAQDGIYRQIYEIQGTLENELREMEEAGFKN